MFCVKCGYQNKDEAKFCFNCGNPLIRPAAADVGGDSENAAAPVPSGEEQPTAPGIEQPAAPPDIVQSAAAPEYNAPPLGYQAPPPKKKRTGLIVGLSIGGVVLAAAVVVIILLLSGSESVEGIWCNETHNEVLAFDDDGNVTVYEPTYEVEGTYEFDARSGKGLIITDDREYDFAVRDSQLIVDDRRGYIRMFDNFDIKDFIKEAVPQPTEETGQE